MSGITIPTLDEITGHTVMAKLRSLCKRFIGLAEEVDEKIDAPLEEAHLAVETANATLATAQESLEDAQSAVTTANSASQTATEASESAQESAETVAGYDTRLTAVENEKINITDINNYAVGLTDNQPNIAGNKGFLGTVTANFFRTSGTDGYRRINIDRLDDELAVVPVSSVLYPLISWNDKNNNLMSAIYVSHLPNGTTSISVQVRNSDGTIKYVTLAQGDVIS